MHRQVLLGIPLPTSCVISDDARLQDWPGVLDEPRNTRANYLTVLTYAWAYIFSALWIEMQGNAEAELRYTDSMANTDDLGVIVDIGGTDESATRWWLAILAPGQGWRAVLSQVQNCYLSPWSISVDGGQTFGIRSFVSSPSSFQADTEQCPPTSSQALKFLSDFCALHNISDQASAALAATLTLPACNIDRCAARLPLLKLSDHLITSPPAEGHDSGELLRNRSLLPYLMMISSNPMGVKASLCGVFFEPGIDCNTVSAWLEPARTSLDLIIKDCNYKKLATVLALRRPDLASMWLGAIITGATANLFRHAMSGTPPIELHSGAWTASMHTFIGLKPCGPYIKHGDMIHRADEWRLLYITGGVDVSPNPPISPWQPFGCSFLGNTSAEVQEHARCFAHFLQYEHWQWTWLDGTSAQDTGYESEDRAEPEARTFELHQPTGQAHSPISEDASERSTRAIFNWRGMSGYSHDDSKIYHHPWIADVDDSPETPGEASSYQHSLDGSANQIVDEWLLDT